MNEIIEKENVIIENMIYEVRGKQVMLDSDLAKLYNCKNGTKEINQAVKNNLAKFPERYSWILTKEENLNLRSKILTSNLEKSHGGRRYNIRVFTEQGVAMLSTVIKSKVAAEISVKIMDAFVSMRHYLNANLLNQNNNLQRISNLETKIIEHDTKIELIQNTLDKMSEKIKNNHLFYDGQIYDAYSLMIDIFNLSKESIVIIDNYLDKNLLDILSKTNKEVLVITNKYNEKDLNKYLKEYSNIEIKIVNKIHDRFIIIDNKSLYHFGASFKDLGTKCFAISKIEDKEILEKILRYINN